MDANLQRPYLLAGPEHWARRVAAGAERLHYDVERRLYRLRSVRTPNWQEDAALAAAQIQRVPGSIDRFATRARWDATRRQVMASGVAETEVPIYSAAAGETLSDVCIGHDDVLYLAAGHVVLKDLRQRWDPVRVEVAPDFQAFRLAARPAGGCFALDPESARIGLVSGLPLRPRSGISYSPNTFRPRLEDRDPPRGRVLPLAHWPATELPIAIACSPGGRLALLTWVQNADARVRVLDETEAFGPALTLQGARAPYDLAWVGDDKLALLIARRDDASVDEAIVYALEGDAQELSPVGDLYPLRGFEEISRDTRLGDVEAWPRFVHNTRATPTYANRVSAEPLLPISWASFAQRGEASSFEHPGTSDDDDRPLDAGDVHAVWHRLYLEASIPPGCSVVIRLATTDERPPPVASAAWHEHRFEAVSEAPDDEVPRGVWVPQASELPFHPGLLECKRVPRRSGLWTALIQRAGLRVRSLVGRYLWVRMELSGDGRATPEVAALRVYGARRSYVQNYLPELYHEQVFGSDAEAAAPATSADFLERFLGNFEGILTPLEDRIKSSWLLTDPSGTPEGALDWLASWVGFSFAPAIPAARRRALLANALTLYKWRGTLAGLELALDLATGGGVFERRDIVVFEDYRLRRTFATILGANLAEADDPLVPGLSVSGNSFVGDSLFLGDESNPEFLALFAADLQVSQGESAAIADLLERLAHRATVLVHNEVNVEDLGLIRQIVEREAPAHVEVQVLIASRAFLVGMSALVGIDTFLARKPDDEPVRVDVSTLGARDRVQHLPSLDPRLDAPLAGPEAP